MLCVETGAYAAATPSDGLRSPIDGLTSPTELSSPCDVLNWTFPGPQEVHAAHHHILIILASPVLCP